jgi:hypothetical protein
MIVEHLCAHEGIATGGRDELRKETSMPTLHHLTTGHYIVQTLARADEPMTAEAVHVTLRTTWSETPGEAMFTWCITGMINDGDLLRDDTGRLSLTEQGRRLARDGYFTPSRRSSVAQAH